MAVGFPTKVTYANGDVFSASDINDTNGTLNLATGAQWAAGKSKIINGDFFVNQRNFTSTTTNAAYGFDRTQMQFTGGTVTYSAQTFTVGAAPVAGYEGKNFARLVSASQSAVGDYACINQPIESVRTLAGQTATFSVWAKASTGTPKIGLALDQNFGSGGSAQVTTSGGTATITTAWVRYTFTVSVPSISGKTVGTGDYLRAWIFTSAGTSISAAGYPAVGVQNVTVDFWGLQLEQGSTATAFQTATGTIQGELAACQRYYWRQTGGYAYSGYGTGAAQSTTNAQVIIPLPVTMRVNPASIDYSTLAVFDLTTVRAVTAASILTSSSSQNTAYCDFTVASGLTQYRPQYVINNNNTAGYIGFSAEL